jgi:hypothetical protein
MRPHRHHLRFMEAGLPYVIEALQGEAIEANSSFKSPRSVQGPRLAETPPLLSHNVPVRRARSPTVVTVRVPRVGLYPTLSCLSGFLRFTSDICVVRVCDRQLFLRPGMLRNWNASAKYS